MLLILFYLPIIFLITLKYTIPEVWNYAIGSAVLVVVVVSAVYLLNKRMDIMSALKNKVSKIKQKPA